MSGASPSTREEVSGLPWKAWAVGLLCVSGVTALCVWAGQASFGGDQPTAPNQYAVDCTLSFGGQSVPLVADTLPMPRCVVVGGNSSRPLVTALLSCNESLVQLVQSDNVERCNAALVGLSATNASEHVSRITLLNRGDGQSNGGGSTIDSVC